MLTARELSLRGADVTLVERGALGQESSWAGGGILSPLYPWRYPDAVNQLAFRSQSVYPKLCKSLRDHTGIDPQWTASGLLIKAKDEHETALAWANTHGKPASLLTQTDIAALEPALDPPGSAIWLPDIAQVRNPRLTRALAVELKHLNTNILDDTRVAAIRTGQGRIQGISTQRGDFDADQVVICAGSWSRQLVEHLPVFPVRGQMILFRAPPGAILHMYLSADRYAIPRQDGRILFGSTLEEDGYRKTLSSDARDGLASLARRRYPVLRDYPIEHHWAGLRPGTRSGIPFICKHPDIEGLYINAGHFRNGLVLAPASVELCVDLIEGRRPALDLTPYRFQSAADR